MRPRERYARGCFEFKGSHNEDIEVCPGVEWQDGEDLDSILRRLELLTHNAVWVGGDIDEMAERLEGYIQREWPLRAYFIEVGNYNRWVQIYQPWEAK